ncbi:MAG: hypothetical protein ISR45_05340, partial [Rhodospirillales bacterium]|nr:hypothetical protein [Rhodospirillales bacterium]
AGAQEGQFNASLVQGVFSFVSGKIAKTSPDGMTVTTPVATIGIRGTWVAGRAAQEGSNNTISLLPEANPDGSQTVGQLAVSNLGGGPPVVLSTPGATLQVSSAFAALPPPVVFSPQQIQQNFGSTLMMQSATVAAKASNAAAQNAQEAEQAQAQAEQAEAEAEAAAAEAAAAEAAAAEAAAEAEADGDPETIAAAETAAAEAEAKAAEAEAKAAEAEARAAEAEAATAEAEAAQAVAEHATNEMQAQSEAFAIFGGPQPGGDGPADGGENGDAPPDGQGPQGDNISQAAEEAARQAVADGASAEEVFAAAADAAAAQLAAEGDSPEQIAEERAVAEQAYNDAIAAGASPEEAMRSAMAATEAQFGGPDDGFNDGGGDPNVQGGFTGDPNAPGGDFGGNPNATGGLGGDQITTGSDPNITGGFGGDPFFGGGDPFFGGGNIFGGGDIFGGGGLFGGGDPFGGGGDPFFGGGGDTFFGGGGDDAYFSDAFFGGDSFDSQIGEFYDLSSVFDNINSGDNTQQNNQQTESQSSFTDQVSFTTGSDVREGTAENTNFYFSYSTLGGADTITDLGGANQMSFDGLDNIKIKVTTDATTVGTGTVNIWNGFGADETANSGVPATSTPPNQTIAFSDVSQYLFSDNVVPSLGGGYSSQSGIAGSTESEVEHGDVIVLPTLLTSEIGYVIAGTSGSDTITLNQTMDGAIVFGKDGGDTFVIDTYGDRLMIGGITATDNEDDGYLADNSTVSGVAGDGIPDAGRNVFDYSAIDFDNTYGNGNDGTAGLTVAMFGFYGDEPGGSAGISENIASDQEARINDQIWDVSTLIGSADNDTISLYGGGYDYIDGGVGNDTLNIIGGSETLKANSYKGGAGDDTINVRGGVSVVGDIDGGTGTDTIGITYNTVFTHTGSLISIDTLQLLGTTADDTININDTTVTNIETATSMTVSSVNGSSGNDTVNLLTNTANTYSIGFTETINATGTGNDIISMLSALGSGSVIDLDGGTDTVNLYAGANVATFSNVENIVGTGSNDALTVENTLSSVSIDLSTGSSDQLTLAGGANTVTLSGVESVVGSTSADTLTLGSAVSSVAFNMGDLSDTINLWNGTNSGTFTNTETLNMTGTTAQNNLAMGAAYTGTINGVASETDDTLTLFAATNVISVGDVESITASTGSDTITLTTALASGSTINLGGGGTDTINLLAGANTVAISNATTATNINGTASDDSLTGSFTGNGTIDLAGSTGNDTLTLVADGSNTNVVTVSNVEVVTGSTNDDNITVALSDLANGISVDGNADHSTGDTLNITGGGTLTSGNIANVQSFEKWTLSTSASYTITTIAGNVASTDTLTVDASAALASTFDATLETDGTINYTGGSGIDTLTVATAMMEGATAALDGGAGTSDNLILVGTGNMSTSELGGVSNFETWTLSGNVAFTLATAAGNVASGETLTINASALTSAAASVDATLETDGTLNYTGGAGTNALTVSQLMLTGATAALTGGSGGSDALTITGAGTVLSGELTNVTGWETWILSDEAHNLTLDDANGASGSTTTINATAVTSAAVTVNGSAETNGNLSYDGGGGIDTFTGGDLADDIAGNGGADILTGGSGNDTFSYDAASDAGDTITDYLTGTNTLDFATTFGLGGSKSFSASGAEADGNNIILKTDAAVADAAGIQSLIDALGGTLTSNNTLLYTAFNTSTSRAEVWYDADVDTAGSAVLMITLDDVTTLSALSTNFDSTDFTIT